MNATQAQNEIQRLTNKLRDAEKALAKEAAKVAVFRKELADTAREVIELRLKNKEIEMLATRTVGRPADILRQIAALFEGKQ